LAIMPMAPSVFLPCYTSSPRATRISAVNSIVHIFASGVRGRRHARSRCTRRSGCCLWNLGQVCCTCACISCVITRSTRACRRARLARSWSCWVFMSGPPSDSLVGADHALSQEGARHRERDAWCVLTRSGNCCRHREAEAARGVGLRERGEENDHQASATISGGPCVHRQQSFKHVLPRDATTSDDG
jgi:hypothetical protein